MRYYLNYQRFNCCSKRYFIGLWFSEKLDESIQRHAQTHTLYSTSQNFINNPFNWLMWTTNWLQLANSWSPTFTDIYSSCLRSTPQILQTNYKSKCCECVLLGIWKVLEVTCPITSTGLYVPTVLEFSSTLHFAP